MFTKRQPIVLVIDDNLSDIALLEMAWTEAGHDKAIGLHACTSLREAMTWLCEEIPDCYVISGVLVDLMLFDGAGRSAVDRLAESPVLKDVPMVSWLGIELTQRVTDRIRKSATRVWKKPDSWSAWPDFINRFHALLDRRAPSSGTRLTSP
jgi:CheY-like chemotaxis protein